MECWLAILEKAFQGAISDLYSPVRWLEMILGTLLVAVFISRYLVKPLVLIAKSDYLIEKGDVFGSVLSELLQLRKIRRRTFWRRMFLISLTLIVVFVVLLIMTSSIYLCTDDYSLSRSVLQTATDIIGSFWPPLLVGWVMFLIPATRRKIMDKARKVFEERKF